MMGKDAAATGLTIGQLAARIGLVVLGVVAVFAGCNYLLDRARDSAKIPKTRRNPYLIGLGIQMYRNDHEMAYPPDLQVVAEKFSDTNCFIDPDDPSPPAVGSNGLRSSYEYVGPVPEDVPPTFILAYSRKGIHADGRFVLYADGAVAFVTEKALHTPGAGRGYSLQQQYDWLIEHHGSEYSEEQKAAFRKFYEVGEGPGAGDSAALTPSPAASGLAVVHAPAVVPSGRSNPHQIGPGLSMYEDKHGDHYPANLGSVQSDVICDCRPPWPCRPCLWLKRRRIPLC